MMIGDNFGLDFFVDVYGFVTTKDLFPIWRNIQIHVLILRFTWIGSGWHCLFNIFCSLTLKPYSILRHYFLAESELKPMQCFWLVCDKFSLKLKVQGLFLLVCWCYYLGDVFKSLLSMHCYKLRCLKLAIVKTELCS